MCNGLEINQMRPFPQALHLCVVPSWCALITCHQSIILARSHLVIPDSLSFAATLIFLHLDPFQTFPSPSHPRSCHLGPSNQVTNHWPAPLVRAASKFLLSSKSCLLHMGPCKSGPWSGLLPTIDRFPTVFTVDAPLSVLFSLLFISILLNSFRLCSSP